MFKKLKKLLSAKTEKKENHKDQEGAVQKVKIIFNDELAVKNIPKLRDYGITDDEIYQTYVGLNGRERDITWSLYNNLLTKVSEANLIGNIYEDMARMLHEEGKPYKHILEQSFKFKLEAFKKAGITKARILSDRTGKCEVAENLDGKVLTIDKAIEKNLIPSKDCEQEFCNCIYLPI